MKINDPPQLFRKLQELGLTEKPLALFNLEDLQALVEMINLFIDGEELPHYEGNGVLKIPFNAPYKYCYWKYAPTPKEKYELLQEMGVPDEDIHFFMHQRAIDVALGKTDEMGKTIIDEVPF